MTTITKSSLFRPTRLKAETRAEITDQIAKAIIEAEEMRREEKTARLRKARMESEVLRDSPRSPAKKRGA